MSNQLFQSKDVSWNEIFSEPFLLPRLLFIEQSYGTLLIPIMMSLQEIFLPFSW